MGRMTGAVLGLLMLVGAPTLADGRGPSINRLTVREHAQGWQLLFDGHDLDGWRSYGGGEPSASWQVRDGVLMLTANSHKMSGADLVTAGSYGPFELQLDWKIEQGGNSGVLYLARSLPQTRYIYETGLEMQILDDQGHPDGKFPSHRAGALYDLTIPPPGIAHPVGSWNHARLLVEPGHIRQWLNGTLTADVSYGDDAWRARVAASKFAKMPFFGTFASGVIGLQDHGEPVAFRNIKIRPLGTPGAAAR